MFGPGAGGLLFFSVFAWILPVVLVLAVVILLLRRATDDPRGRRPYAVYLFSVIFVTLFTAVIGLGMIATAVVGTSVETGRSCSLQPPGRMGSGSGRSGSLSEDQPFPDGINPGAENLEQVCTTHRQRVVSRPMAFQAAVIVTVAGIVLTFHAQLAKELINLEERDDASVNA